MAWLLSDIENRFADFHILQAEDFPQIVPSGTGGDSFPHFDTTTKFDSKIATEWIDGTTKDPLSVGPSIASGRASDARIFNADGNVTMKSLTDPATFASTVSPPSRPLRFRWY